MLVQFSSATCSGFVFQRMTLICDPQCCGEVLLGKQWGEPSKHTASHYPFLICKEKVGKESLLKTIIKKLCMGGMWALQRFFLTTPLSIHRG